jgi:hypothetical protein
MALVPIFEHQQVEGNVVRGRQGDFFRSCHRDVPRDGRPGASLPP